MAIDMKITIVFDCEDENELLDALAELGWDFEVEQ